MKTLIRPEPANTSEQPAPFKEGSPNLATNAAHGSSVPAESWIYALRGWNSIDGGPATHDSRPAWSIPSVLTSVVECDFVPRDDTFPSAAAVEDWDVEDLVARNTVEAVRAMTPWTGSPDITVAESGTIVLDWESGDSFATAEVGATTFGLLISSNGKPTLMKNGPVRELALYGHTVATALDLNPGRRALWSLVTRSR